MRARYLDPKTGRFLARDPLTADHTFTYTKNNPISYVDPLGLFETKLGYTVAPAEYMCTTIWKQFCTDSGGRLLKRLQSWCTAEAYQQIKNQQLDAAMRAMAWMLKPATTKKTYRAPVDAKKRAKFIRERAYGSFRWARKNEKGDILPILPPKIFMNIRVAGKPGTIPFCATLRNECSSYGLYQRLKFKGYKRLIESDGGKVELKSDQDELEWLQELQHTLEHYCCPGGVGIKRYSGPSLDFGSPCR